MGFDFGYTCPVIDRGLSDIEEIMKEELDWLSYNMEDENSDSLTADFMIGLLRRVSEVFEEVRTSNEDMRKAANNQVEELEGHVEDLNYQLTNRLDEINSLEAEVSRLNEELYLKTAQC